MKMMEEQTNQTIEQLVFFLMFQKYLKDAFLVSYTITLIRLFFKKPMWLSTQHVLLVMIEKIKIARDNKEFCAAILTNLSKACYCICHDLIIAKLGVYRFDQNALNLIYDYLSDRSKKLI